MTPLEKVLRTWGWLIVICVGVVAFGIKGSRTEREREFALYFGLVISVMLLGGFGLYRWWKRGKEKRSSKSP